MSSGPHGLEVGSPGLIWREWVSPPRHVLQLKTATVPELDRGAQQWQAKDVLAVGASLTPARQVRPGCRTSVSASLGLPGCTDRQSVLGLPGGPNGPASC